MEEEKKEERVEEREVRRRRGGRRRKGGRGIMYKYLPSTLVPYSHTVKCTHISPQEGSECLTANVLFRVMQ